MNKTIYTVVDNKIVPYVDQSGHKFNTRSKAQKQRHTKYAKDHNKFYNFYNSYQWHSLSYRYRKSHSICENCLRLYHAGKIPLSKVNIASSVDHIVKLKDDWSKRFDSNNLQSLCWKCHHAKDHNLF